MKDYKFRGIRLDNKEWVVGSLVKLNSHDSTESAQIVIESGHSFEVDPKTAGEIITEAQVLAVKNMKGIHE